MLKVCSKPFMSYSICHESWLYPKFTMQTWGFNAQGISITHRVLGFKDYRYGDKNQRSGGQCG